MRAPGAEPPPGARNRIVKERVRRPLLGFRPATASTGRGPPPSGLPYEASAPNLPAAGPSLPGPRHSSLHRGPVWRPLLGFRPATASTGRGPPPSGRSYKRTRPPSPAGHPFRSDRPHRPYSFLRSAWERTSSTLCVVWNGRGASEAAVPNCRRGVHTPRSLQTVWRGRSRPAFLPRLPSTPRAVPCYHYNAYSPAMRRWRPGVRRRAMTQAMCWEGLMPRGSDASFFRHLLESCSVHARVGHCARAHQGPDASRVSGEAMPCHFL